MRGNEREEITYRKEMRVRAVMVIGSGNGRTGYAVCPRCGVTMEREYMNYCTWCGQKLGWRGYRKAEEIYPGKGKAASGGRRRKEDVT